jgi:hypothetical protein
LDVCWTVALDGAALDKRRIAFSVLVPTVLGLMPMATPASGCFGFRPRNAFHSVPLTWIVDMGKNLGITGLVDLGERLSS